VGPPRYRRDGLLPQGQAVCAAGLERRDPRHARRARPRRGATELNPAAIGLALIGAVWGFAADRIATRWPDHDEAEGFQAGRPIGWRTVVVALLGALALAALADRFSDPVELGLFVAWFLALTLLLATDLDQRLLPDLVTLPLVPLAALAVISGIDPLVQGPTGILAAVAVAIAVPLVLYLLSIPFGPGAIGMGDLKLLVSVGLLSGLVRTVTGIVAGAFLAGVVLGVLLVTRRITLRTYIPFGPFLIVGAFWAVLVRYG